MFFSSEAQPPQFHLIRLVDKIIGISLAKMTGIIYF